MARQSTSRGLYLAYRNILYHDEIIDYYINFLEKPETLYTFTEKIISLLKSFIK